MNRPANPPSELLTTEHRFRGLIRELQNASDGPSTYYRRAASSMATLIRKTRLAGGSGSELMPEALKLATTIDEFLEAWRRDREHGQHVFNLAMSMETDPGLDPRKTKKGK